MVLARYLLHGARGVYAASESVTQEEFEAYVRSRDLAGEFPGVVGMGYVRRSDGGRFVVTYAAPADWSRRRLGEHVSADPVLREALERAVDSASMTLSGRSSWWDPEAADGDRLAMFVPVYEKGDVPTTAEGRRAALAGVLCAEVSLGVALRGAASAAGGQVDFAIFDGESPERSALLFDFDGHLCGRETDHAAPGADEGRLFQFLKRLNAGGRPWTMLLSTTPEFDAHTDGTSVAVVGWGGGLVSLAMAVLVFVMGTSRARAVALAEEMTVDLTRQRDLAEAAARAKSEFLANMSHEIRTPMTAILGYTQLLADEGDLEQAPPHRREFIGTIRRNGEHLLALINDILDLSKIEAGKMTVERIATDPGAMLSEVEALMRVKARDKGLTLDVVRETALPATIRTDPVRLKQVLVNLVGNAIKFTETGGVTIRAGLDRHAAGGPVLRVEVADTGIGMTPEQLSRLFGAFEQADASTTRRFGGTGLGLRISKSLIEALGGEITVRSVPGAGSVFELTVATGDLTGVDMIEAPERSHGGNPVPVVREAASRPLEGMRVWLAEDGPDNQRLISYVLTKAGAEVRVFDHGRAAWEAMAPGGVAAGSPCDVLLTDMQMPEMDGYSLARALRAAGWSGPIVALTAHAMSGDAQRCLDAGCDAYASKPIDRAALIRLCQQMRGRATRRAA